jgi:signal transduction histidine kinase
MTQTLDLETVLAKLLEQLGRVVPFDRARIMLREGESLLRVRATMREGHGLEFVASRSPQFDAGDNSVIRELLACRKGLIIEDTHAHPEWGPRMLPEFAHSWMGFPLIVRSKAIGLCSLSAARAGVFSPGHLQLAEALSAPAAVAIRNAMLFEKVRAGRERLQMLSRKLVDRQENERRVVARELNDEAGQALTSIKIGLRLLERESSNAAVSECAAGLQRTAEGVQQSLHRLAANLRPPALDQLGLVAALDQLGEDLFESSGVKIQFEAIGLEGDRLSGRIETELFRIAQEAVTNAIRHAAAGEIGIILQRRDARLQLIVEDDGRGFDPAAAERGERLGLAVMRERVENLGGTLLIESAPGRGTTVVVEVPQAPQAP